MKKQSFNRKLTPAQVRQIRRAYFGPKQPSFMVLAKRYNVSGATIGQVIWGDTWRHIGGPVRFPR
jgi:hypothetical protein